MVDVLCLCLFYINWLFYSTKYLIFEHRQLLVICICVSLCTSTAPVLIAVHRTVNGKQHNDTLFSHLHRGLCNFWRMQEMFGIKWQHWMLGAYPLRVASLKMISISIVCFHKAHYSFCNTKLRAGFYFPLAV